MDQFLYDQIAATESDILSLNTAIRFLTDNPTAKYDLDTGQSQQSVTRQDLERLKNMRSSLYAERDVLKQRTGSTPVINAPGW